MKYLYKFKLFKKKNNTIMIFSLYWGNIYMGIGLKVFFVYIYMLVWFY